MPHDSKNRKYNTDRISHVLLRHAGWTEVDDGDVQVIKMPDGSTLPDRAWFRSQGSAISTDCDQLLGFKFAAEAPPPDVPDAVVVAAVRALGAARANNLAAWRLQDAMRGDTTLGPALDAQRVEQDAYSALCALAGRLHDSKSPEPAPEPSPARPDYSPPADVRSYVTDDADIDAERHRLDLHQGENGDWYLSVLPAADRFTRACVRVTTSGTKRHGMPAAMRALWNALAPPAKAEDGDDR